MPTSSTSTVIPAQAVIHVILDQGDTLPLRTGMGPRLRGDDGPTTSGDIA
jgi:hypothetical protein